MLIPPDQGNDVPQILNRVKRGERVEHFEIDRIRKDGKQIDVSLTHSPIKDASGKIVAASTIAREFTERKLIEDHRKLLVAELDHRIKNTLLVISSLIAQTVKSAASPADFARIVQGRIRSLSRVHDLLNLHQQSHAELHDVVSGQLAAYRPGKEDRIRILGTQRICLTAKAAQTLSMAMHELCTNAAKYGALSTSAGQVDVSWQVTNSTPDARLSLEWIEGRWKASCCRYAAHTTPASRGLVENYLACEVDASASDEHASRNYDEAMYADRGTARGSADPARFRQ
ncbi:sensor histidine kinase [Peristeroidobacter agariperforans]|uniref:sensor histidine kinase n=1 Tax=Peristeroidobacter agariperforans TaxID=268404 RepID=UPI001E3EEEC7|nr:HWE histidine kinase domain-containing protein [Peristeroidobacter agariperforans]